MVSKEENALKKRMELLEKLENKYKNPEQDSFEENSLAEKGFDDSIEPSFKVPSESSREDSVQQPEVVQELEVVQEPEVEESFNKLENESEKENSIISSLKNIFSGSKEKVDEEKEEALKIKNNLKEPKKSGKALSENYKGKPSVKKASIAEINWCEEKIKKIKKEVSKAMIGQEEIINGLIMGLICNGHVLVEGVPGIAKTLAIRCLAVVSGCEVKRIQFTVDMLPTDIIGINSYTPEKGFEFIKGPIFANFLIADEINRAPPKTQSALIEGMQEKQVSTGRKKFVLPDPFFVMATENPIENSGVYPLPEAQIDRFLLKLLMPYPEEEEEKIIMESNITLQKFESFNLKSVTTPKEIIKMQKIVREVYLDDSIRDYIVSLVRKTRKKDFESAKYLNYGASPRASIGLFIVSKAYALIHGRNFVLPEDVKAIAAMVLRHRILLSYKASIEKVSSDDIIKEILSLVKVD